MAIGCSTPGPECSPVSCKGVATELEVNRHCLFDSLEQAKGNDRDGRETGAARCQSGCHQDNGGGDGVRPWVDKYFNFSIA